MRKLLLSAFVLAGLASCEPNQPNPSTEGPYEKAKLVLNEGPFGSGSGTLTALWTDSTEADAFATANGFPLGNIVQHATQRDTLLFVAVNVGEVVHGMTRSTLQHQWTANVPSPRGLWAEQGRLFVSSWAGTKIYELDAYTGAMLDSIEVYGQSEAMMVHDGALYVALNGGFSNDHRVARVNLSNYAVDTLLVGDKPNSFAALNNDLYVLCSGYTDWVGSGSTPGSIWKIEAGSSIASELATGPTAADQASSLYLSGSTFYFLNGTYGASVVSWSEGQAWPTAELVASDAYNMTVLEDTIYLFDAKDFASNGVLSSYTLQGNFVDSATVGVVPRQIIK